MFVPAASLVQSFAQSSELADINCTRTTNADRHKLTAASKGLSECISVTCVVEKGEGNIHNQRHQCQHGKGTLDALGRYSLSEVGLNIKYGYSYT